MVSRHHQGVGIVVAAPVPKGVLAHELLAKEQNVARKHKHIAHHLKRVLLQEPGVLLKLQVQVAGILYLHNYLL